MSNIIVGKTRSGKPKEVLVTDDGALATSSGDENEGIEEMTDRDWQRAVLSELVKIRRALCMGLEVGTSEDGLDIELTGV